MRRPAQARTGAAVEFPVRQIHKAWHVGTLNPADKQPNSHEGAGLSISNCPDAWRRIARGKVAGPCWEASKTGGQFLTLTEFKPIHATLIAEWAIRYGYAERKPLYRYAYYDDEMESEIFYLFENRDDAVAQCYEGDEDAVTVIPQGLVATDALRTRTLNQASPVMVSDLLATLYAEDVLHIDGVWWQTDVDVYAYRAPKGVIVPSRVAEWTFVPSDL